MRPGAKYYWWELRGVPLRLELGPGISMPERPWQSNGAEEKPQFPLQWHLVTSRGYLAKSQMRSGQKQKRTQNYDLGTADSMDALNSALNEGNVAVVRWCRERGCGNTIEEKANSSLLGTEVRSEYIEATDGPALSAGSPARQPSLAGHTDFF